MFSINTLVNTIEKISLSYGSDFFHKMTESLAQAVSADICLIARLDAQSTYVDTLSVYAHGQHIDDFQYDLQGTPCQEVACGRVGVYPANVARLFPEDKMLVEEGIQAYVGASLKDVSGEAIGVVVALYHKALVDPDSVHKLYVLFSSRIALEIDRMDKTRLLEASNQHLEHRVQQRTAELEQANHEIKRFAYIVSHDLRAPLVNIKGFSAELKYSLRDLQTVLTPHYCEQDNAPLAQILTEDLPEAIGFIEASANKMDDQINAILALSRMGSRVLKPETLDMNTLIQQQLTVLQHLLDKNHVVLKIEDLPLLVADRLCIEQIFANLLGNAVKYLQPDQAGLLHISAEQEAGRTVFHLEDNGRGISEKEQSGVFDLFTRAGQQDTLGEGMGLAYIKTLVQRHGGNLWCDSTLGKGSIFSFSIQQS